MFQNIKFNKFRFFHKIKDSSYFRETTVTTRLFKIEEHTSAHNYHYHHYYQYPHPDLTFWTAATGVYEELTTVVLEKYSERCGILVCAFIERFKGNWDSKLEISRSFEGFDEFTKFGGRDTVLVYISRFLGKGRVKSIRRTVKSQIIRCWC